jgi:hypothetical protein
VSVVCINQLATNYAGTLLLCFLLGLLIILVAGRALGHVLWEVVVNLAILLIRKALGLEFLVNINVINYIN